MSKGKEASDESCDKILKYMEQQNRPYSAIDIFTNLHKAIGKTMVIKCLDALVQKNVVKEKSYGKQKVYVYNQENVQTAQNEELKQMDTEIDRLVSENQLLQKEINQLSTTHKNLQAGLTLEDAKQRLKSVSQEIKGYTDKLAKLRSGTVLISEDEKKRVKHNWSNRIGTWKKRKRMAIEMLDTILEGCPLPKKSLYEDIGIETDEDCNVTIPK